MPNCLALRSRSYADVDGTANAVMPTFVGTVSVGQFCRLSYGYARFLDRAALARNCPVSRKRESTLVHTS